MAEYQSKHTGAQIDAGIDRANAALPVSGGAMTGLLLLSGDPSADLGAATKRYVDSTAERILRTPGADGATFIPSMTRDGVLTWTNNAGLANPMQVNLRGPEGISPRVAVSQIANGHRVTITDAAGEQSFDVLNGSGGSAGVSSWNDLTDKPFGDVNLVPLIPETTTLISEGMGAYDEAPFPKIPLVGGIYQVMWNGASYRVTGQSPSAMGAAPGDSSVVLGNIGAMSGGADSGEPFIIVLSPDHALEAYAAVIALDGSESVSWSVTEEVFAAIPQSFLPADYPLMWVNVSGDNPSDWTGDRSYLQISNAVNSGAMVYLRIKNSGGTFIAPLMGAAEGSLLFEAVNVIYALSQDGTYSQRIE